MSTSQWNGGRRGGMINLDAWHPSDLIDPLARNGGRRGGMIKLDSRHPLDLIDPLARNGCRRSGMTKPFALHPPDLIEPLAPTSYMCCLNPPKEAMHNACSDFTVPVILVDWLETDHTHIFKASLPGFKKEDVKVEVEGGVVHITGECKKDEMDKNDKWHRSERPHGTVSHCFRLPENVRLDQVKANMANGVLTLTVPKTAESKPQVMPIEISEN